MSMNEEESSVQELVIIRRRGGEEEGAHKGGVWKIAYADFMTAMMAFFLVMWLINATDKQVLTQVATYFNPLRLTDRAPVQKGVHDSEGAPGGENDTSHAKQTDSKAKGAKLGSAGQEGAEGALFKDPFGALDKLAKEAALAVGERSLIGAPGDRPDEARRERGSELRDPFDPDFKVKPHKEAAEVGRPAADAPQPAAPAGQQASPAQAAAKEPASGTEKAAAAASTAAPAQAAEKEAKQAAEVANLEAEIKQALAQMGPGTPDIDVKVTEDGLLISLTDKFDFGMFAIASAEPRPATVLIMEKLAKVLQTRSGQLVVRGHTDGRPFRSPNYDNWRLSTARSHMAYYMLVRGGVEEKRFERIEGHADRSLRVADDPGAAQNRRIEILLRAPKP
jgi:chemotaxis protein MotB